MPFTASLSILVDLRNADSIYSFTPEAIFNCMSPLRPIKGIPAKATKVVLHSYTKDNTSPTMMLETSQRTVMRIVEVKYLIFLQSRSTMADSSADEFYFLSKKATSMLRILSKDSWRILELTYIPTLLKIRFSAIVK
jgi:hypothetical protein